MTIFAFLCYDPQSTSRPGIGIELEAGGAAYPYQAIPGLGNGPQHGPYIKNMIIYFQLCPDSPK
ncbi:MAG: hypothetical protein N839_0004185 [Desulfofustis sp. PB-SRB1]|nr:hypothetical protein [Desulfofustis sp. PB-SRB1]